MSLLNVFCSRRNKKINEKMYWCVLGYCLILVSTFFLDMRYPYQCYNLFQQDLNIDISQKRQWNVIKQRFDFKKNDNSTYCDIYNVSRQYTAQFDCVQTKTIPSTTVCLFNEFMDMFISHDIKHTGVWEPHVLKEFQSVLNRNPNIGVIDLGANIGYYTLIAAKMGHKVVAVEPYYPSIHRMHRAIQIEKLWNHVTVVHNAVSDKRVLATILISGDNQGDTKVHMDHSGCSGASCPPPVNTILMDDLLQVITFNTTVIKLDIQGYECRAMAQANKLLNRLNVPYIFMEWGLMGQYYGDHQYKSAEKYRIQEMIRNLFDLNYRPYSLSDAGSKALDPLRWNKWPFDIIWQKLLNTQEYEQLLQSHFMNWP